MALNSLLCADVLLRTYTLTHSCLQLRYHGCKPTWCPLK